MDSTGISFTALFTGQVWYESGISNRFFTSPKGRLLYKTLRPFDRLADSIIGITLHDMLIQRHQIMDHRIDGLIKTQGVSQILEIACGYSPRGYTLSRKYPDLKYVEADLPHMAERKRALLQANHGFGPDHQVVGCDVFEFGAPYGLDYVMEEVLDPDRPTILVTEGLVNYFHLDDISQVWQRLAQLGRVYPKAWYITDLVYNFGKHLIPGAVAAGSKMLSLATRANVNLHFNNRDEIQRGFLECGFTDVQIHRPEDFVNHLPIPMGKSKSVVRVVESQIHAP
ncbi:class I SAM-dependent methyltransferase [Ketobacter sp.]|nr:MAG: class I SAM-dependent methyltransferase [Ketobacter sp.]